MNWLFLALSSMFVQQTFVTLGKTLPAVLAPAVFLDVDLDPSWLGVYVGMMSAASLVVQLGCGSLIVRYGALRVSQVSLLSTGFGLGLAATGLVPTLAISAIVIGTAMSATPASSHLLGRYASRKHAPLVFSVKQTAVPTALLLAGLLGPLLTDIYDWQTTLVIVAAGAIVFAVMLQPLRAEFDSDKDTTRRFRMSDFKGTVLFVLRASELRALAFGAFAFVGLQATVTAYFVIYLTNVGYSLAGAGQIFAIATAVAVGGRIFWGWLSSTYVSPRVMLGLLAIGMFMTVGITSMFDELWPVWHVTLVAALVSATVFSWHGVLLSEAARLAPENMRGTVTGGVLSFGQFGGLVLPLAYSLVLGSTGSYSVGFVVCALPALVIGLLLLLTHRRAGPR